MNSVIYERLDVHKESLNYGAITDYGKIFLEKHSVNNYPKIRKDLPDILQGIIGG